MHRNTVFSQILQLICRYRFKKCVDRYRGDNYTRRFSCWQQLLVLLFAQARGLTSLRDIEVSLRSHHREWYHLGLTSVARSTLADANTGRDADVLEMMCFMSCWQSTGTLLPVIGSRSRTRYTRSIRRLSRCVCRSIRGRPIEKRRCVQASHPARPYRLPAVLCGNYRRENP